MNKNLRAIAVDDEPKALEIIQMHTAKVPFLTLCNSFRDPIEAIEWVRTHPIDVIFLDINMPQISGLKFRELIGEEVMIVFTTAYSKYAVESYELKAVDYLLKPIPFDRFLKATIKAQELYSYKAQISSSQKEYQPSGHHHIYVKSGTKLHKLNTDDILYFQKEGNYVVFHTKHKKILSRLNMNQVLELIPEIGFLRVHKSYIVNLLNVEIIESHQLTVGGYKIPVAKPYREKVKQQLMN